MNFFIIYPFEKCRFDVPAFFVFLFFFLFLSYLKYPPIISFLKAAFLLQERCFFSFSFSVFWRKGMRKEREFVLFSFPSPSPFPFVFKERRKRREQEEECFLFLFLFGGGEMEKEKPPKSVVIFLYFFENTRKKFGASRFCFLFGILIDYCWLLFNRITMLFEKQ